MNAAYIMSAVLFGFAALLSSAPGAPFLTKVVLTVAALSLFISLAVYGDTAFQSRTGWFGRNRERIAIDLVTVSAGLSFLTIMVNLFKG